MIQDVNTAKRALELIEQADKLLIESMDLVRSGCSDEEHKDYRRGMAHVTGRLFFLVMEPIYRQHPSLAPPDTPPEFLEAWAKGNSPREQEPGDE
jgi:hypothetical protein